MNFKLIIILAIIITLFVILKKKENFRNYDYQSIDILDKSIGYTKNLEHNEGIYTIQTVFGSSDKFTNFLFIGDDLDESISIIDKDEGLNFSFVNNKDSDLLDENLQPIIDSRSTTLQIKNGIFINELENEKGFNFSRLYIKNNENSRCFSDLENNDLFCTGKEYSPFKIIQYFNPEETQEVLYFILYKDKFLYVEDNKGLKLKSLDMNTVCSNLDQDKGYKYYNNKDINKFIDIDTVDDLKFNRSFNDIPKTNVCPKDYPYACSDETNWRNYCSKAPKINNKNDPTNPTNGRCDDKFEKKQVENNTSMRNFYPKGLKCYLEENHNTKIKVNLDRIKEIDNIFKEFDIKQFLFRINSFTCFSKTSTSEKDQVNFCYNQNPIINDSNNIIPSFNQIEIVRSIEKCPDDGIQIMNNFTIGDNKFKLCGKVDTTRQNSITEIVVKEKDDDCNDINDDKNKLFPSKWKKIENKSEALGCFGRIENYLDFDDSSKTTDKTFNDCKKNCKTTYYSYLDNNTCYNFDNIPNMLKYNDFNKCSNLKKEGNYFKGSVDNELVNKTVIYKNKQINENNNNIRSNRLYYGLSYVIYNQQNNIFLSKNENNFLLGENNNNLNNASENNNYFFKIEPVVNNIDKNTPINYKKEFYLLVYINGEKYYLTPNYLKTTDIFHITDSKNEYIELDIENKKTNPIMFSDIYRSSRRFEMQSELPIITTNKKIDELTKYSNFIFRNRNVSNFIQDPHKCIEEDETFGKNKNIYGKTDCRGTKRKSRKKHLFDLNKSQDTDLYYFDDEEKFYNINVSNIEDDKYTEKLFNYNSGDVFPKKLESNGNIEFNINGIVIMAAIVHDKDQNGEAGQYHTRGFREAHCYGRQTRLLAPKELLESKEFSHNYNYDNEIAIKKLISDKYIIPSKINKYNIEINETINENYGFEKKINNFSFKLINESESTETEKKMKFQVININNTDDDTIVNLENDICLYNDDYKIYLSLNTKDEHNLSCISNHNFESEKDNYCKLKMKMGRITPEDDKTDYKFCYNSKPFQAVDFGKISISNTKCNDKDVKIGYTKLNSGEYYFCSKQENISKTNNDGFKKYDYSENKPFRPYPL
uniref:Uncharacterized protein n=1 Tax=Mimiviridae sp. ChoanoV1 TaxID=2596887 RepID=A0A5B8IIL5_9VIRU|nr:hypothetical protein 4_52 [Mimiviridae sp. ChoanoV1]